MNRTIAFSAAFLAGCILQSCTVGPNYQRPAAAEPPAWSEPLESGLTPEPVDLAEWWRGFNDERLDGLVERALAGNLDLREAAARVREARALRGIAGADAMPSVDARGSASNERFSENTRSSGAGSGGTSELYQVGFDASWELDVFGGVRRSVEAADADVGSEIEAARDVRVTLVAEVARNYVEYRSFQARLAIAEENVRIQRETVGVSRSRVRAGVAGELELAQALAQFESSQAQIPELTTGMRRAAYRLDVLLGMAPGVVATELASGAPVPPTPSVVPVGVPAELLRRRPDIRAAERDVAAATARIGAATADLYPRFVLNGAFGLESEHLGSLFDAGSRAWSAGPFEVRWPIFDGGRIRGNIVVQEARQERAIAAYERTVLEAYEEVANTLVGYAQLRQRRESLRRAVEASRDSVSLANELWSRGLTDFLNVLRAQEELYRLDDQLAETDAAVTTNLIALYKALGGGWEPPSEAAVATVAP